MTAYVYLPPPPFPRNEVNGVERLVWLKYYIVLKRQIITFSLGLDAEKNTGYMEKSFQ